MTPFGWQHAKVKSTKSNPPSKVAKSAFMGTLIEQPPQAQIRSNAKYFCAHQIANDQMIVLSPENPQKRLFCPYMGMILTFVGHFRDFSINILHLTLFVPVAAVQSVYQ